ncbi:hypothetical protein [Streptomyces sp. SYSU K217416]
MGLRPCGRNRADARARTYADAHIRAGLRNRIHADARIRARARAVTSTR